MLIELLLELFLGTGDTALGMHFFAGHRVIGVLMGMVITTAIYIIIHAEREARRMKRNGYVSIHKHR